MTKTIPQRIYAAIKASDVPGVRQLLEENPEFFDFKPIASTWLHNAARVDNVQMIEMLLELGFDVNARGKVNEDGPLMDAIDFECFNVANYLLSRGADPNQGRTLIAAINRESNALEWVKLLVERGADVNRCFPFGDDDGPIFSVLSWAIDNEKPDVADYLRSKGAVQCEKEQPAQAPKSLSEEVVAHFRGLCGPVHPRSLGEIVPDDVPITIHVVRASEQRRYLTLFTTGVSAQPMTVPQGEEQYRYAELMIDLPAGWPLGKGALDDANHRWPIDWLRRLGKYPHQQRTWLGGAVTIVSNGDPPQRLSANNHFTAMLLLAESDFRSRDGRTIQLYRLLPLYAEEHQLELQQGVGALMRALDQFNISSIVDLKRPNVARSS